MAAQRPRFASRTAWNLAPNRLARLAEEKRCAGEAFLDLTESNPTRCGFHYEEEAILEALADRRGLKYDPDPRGLLKARRAVVGYYQARQVSLAPDQVLLTSGSSEAYGYLFRLLAEPGANVLAPRPSYPLFEFLSSLNDIELRSYALDEHHRWQIDFGTLEAAVDARSRAIVVVSPNNPTGSLLKAEERPRLLEFCRLNGLALIADEVFLDYCLAGQGGSLAGEDGALTFVLSGLSKTAALPQMKLGWIAAAGPEEEAAEALGRLEIMADTYLSVGTAVQWALPRLLEARHAIQREILDRLAENLNRLDRRLAHQSLVSRLEVEAGWSVVLRLPSIQTDEEWALELLGRDGILVHPGHFFDFLHEGYLVLSLLPPAGVFEEGIARLLARVEERAEGGS